MLDHMGAAEFWPEDTRFGTAAEAGCMIKAAQPGKWRALIVERFSLDAQLQKLRHILAPVVDRVEFLRIGVADDLLDVLPQANGAVRLDMRPEDEMEAAEFLLTSMGYKRTGKCRDGVLFGVC
jgi:hypothetical protein